MTTHEPTLQMLKEIKKKKQELAELMFSCYMSLNETDKKYVDIMMDDNDIEEFVNDVFPNDKEF